MERVKGEFSLSTGNVNDTFRFPHESFYRQIIEMNHKAKEVFAPPIVNYSGLDDRIEHVFHYSFKAIWGETN